MKANIGSADKAIRLGLAIVLIALFYTEVLKGTVGIIALIIALLLAITSLINYCPLYPLLKINTAIKKTKKKE
ncbi:MAG: hypothetical protein H6Q20_857 [Bacteroidetes bacterium]|jgi:Na+/H+ antiporter NhaA|nr:hypothetical protein [Bacteroidota bacterium]